MTVLKINPNHGDIEARLADQSGQGNRRFGKDGEMEDGLILDVTYDGGAMNAGDSSKIYF